MRCLFYDLCSCRLRDVAEYSLGGWLGNGSRSAWSLGSMLVFGWGGNLVNELIYEIAKSWHKAAYRKLCCIRSSLVEESLDLGAMNAFESSRKAMEGRISYPASI